MIALLLSGYEENCRRRSFLDLIGRRSGSLKDDGAWDRIMESDFKDFAKLVTEFLSLWAHTPVKPK